MAYKWRYGRTYKEPNFQAEKFEVEQDFDDSISKEDATRILSAAIKQGRQYSLAKRGMKESNENWNEKNTTKKD